jgi:hypothetical protein
MQMKKILIPGPVSKVLFALSILMTFSGVWAQTNCLIVDQIARWEILDSDKAIVYDSQGNSIAFVIFGAGYLKKSGETFRFFSSTICRGDRVQKSSGSMDTIFSIEPIRK